MNAFPPLEPMDREDTARPRHLEAVPDLREDQARSRDGHEPVIGDEVSTGRGGSADGVIVGLCSNTIESFVFDLRRRGRAWKTCNAYRNDLSLLVTYEGGYLPIEHLDVAASNWLNNHRNGTWSAATVKRRKAAVRSFAKFAGVHALEDYKAPSNPKPVPHPLPGGVNDVAKLLDVADTFAKRFFVVACGYMGLRANEALSIRKRDIDQDNWRIRVHGKGSKERWVPIPSHAQIVVAIAYVSATDENDRIVKVTYRTALRWVQAMAKKAGIGRDIATHCLRMTAGTHVYRKTGDLRVAQELLGHADPRTTAAYTAVEWNTIADGLEL